MRLSCVLPATLALAGLVPGAFARDASTMPLHRAKTARLVQPRRAVNHAVTKGAAKPASPHAKTAKRSSSAPTSGPATIRRTRLRVRRHYYERFTASSFAIGDIFAGDITTGED